MKLISLAFVILLAFYPALVRADTVQVNVALTSIQPPLVIDTTDRSGLVYDVLNAMNASQDRYKFVPRLTPAKRILSKYQNNETHIIAYNDANWGWVQRGGVGSRPLTMGEDVFFALKKEYRQEEPVEEIGAVLGFHYAFADFDAEKITTMDNVHLVKDEASVFGLVSNERVQKGIVSRTYLGWVSVSNPYGYTKIEIDPEPDHSYTRQLVLLEGSPISITEVNNILNDLVKHGTMQEIYAKYGVEFPE